MLQLRNSASEENYLSLAVLCGKEERTTHGALYCDCSFHHASIIEYVFIQFSYTMRDK